MTNENSISEVRVGKEGNEAGCLGQVGWFFSGAVLPMGSFSFYRKAAQKSVGGAILFFIMFTLVISTLLTLNAAIKAFSVIGSIQQAFADEKVPEITISHGVAEVSGEQPFILVNGSDANGQLMLVAVDTTGKIKEIDTSRYYQGFLLTRNELHMVTPQNGYQRIPLSEINSMMDRDPLIINAETTSQAWGVMSVIFAITAFVFLILWHTLVRLMIISIIALLMWGIVTLIKPNTGFGPIIISGLYAVVPAIYFSHLFSRSNFTFPGVQTFFLLIFWTMGLVVNFVDIPFFTQERPLRLWTALIGLPMLILYIVDIFWQFPIPYGAIALWGVTLLTEFVLAGVRLFFRFKDQSHQQTEQPAIQQSPQE